MEYEPLARPLTPTETETEKMGLKPLTSVTVSVSVNMNTSTQSHTTRILSVLVCQCVHTLNAVKITVHLPVAVAPASCAP